MARDVVRPVAVGILLVLAGCSTGGVGTAPTTSPTGTTTTATTTTATTTNPTAADAQNLESTATMTETTPEMTNRTAFPPGITEEGVTETDLLDQHASRLAETSYAVTLRTSIQTAESDAPATSVRTGKWNATTEQGVIHFSASTVEKTVYANESGAYTKRIVSGKPSYSTRATTLSQRHLTSSSTLRRYVEAMEFTHEGVVTQNGSTYHELTASQVASERELRQQLQASTIESFEATALVSASGVIHDAEFTVQYTPENTSDTLTTIVEYSVSDLGETTVSKPDWVSTASQRSTVVNVSVVGNRSLTVAVEEGGLSAGSDLFVYVAETGQSTIQLNQSVSAGETMYVYFGDGLHVSSERPPDADRITGSYSISGVRPNGLTAFQESGYVAPANQSE